MDDKPKRKPSGSTPLTVDEIVRHAMTDPSQSEALKMAAALIAKPSAGAEAAEQKAVQELERLARLGLADSLSGVGPRLRELIAQQSQLVSFTRIADPLTGPDFRPIADPYSHDQHIRRAEEEERARLRVRDEWEAEKAQAQTQVATPAVPAEPKRTSPVKSRRDLLAPLIEAAQREGKNPFDAPAVFAALLAMAEAKRSPLLGVSDEGIKWRDANDDPQFLTLKHLRDRLSRMKKKAQ